jgi:hypothetical protein
MRLTFVRNLAGIESGRPLSARAAVVPSHVSASEAPNRTP